VLLDFVLVVDWDLVLDLGGAGEVSSKCWIERGPSMGVVGPGLWEKGLAKTGPLDTGILYQQAKRWLWTKGIFRGCVGVVNGVCEDGQPYSVGGAALALGTEVSHWELRCWEMGCIRHPPRGLVVGLELGRVLVVGRSWRSVRLELFSSSADGRNDVGRSRGEMLRDGVHPAPPTGSSSRGRALEAQSNKSIDSRVTV
jgi:hypothetical protein